MPDCLWPPKTWCRSALEDQHGRDAAAARRVDGKLAKFRVVTCMQQVDGVPVGEQDIVAEHDHRIRPVGGLRLEGRQHPLLSDPRPGEQVLFNVTHRSHQERRQQLSGVINMAGDIENALEPTRRGVHDRRAEATELLQRLEKVL